MRQKSQSNRRLKKERSWRGVWEADTVDGDSN